MGNKSPISLSLCIVFLFKFEVEIQMFTFSQDYKQFKCILLVFSKSIIPIIRNT